MESQGKILFKILKVFRVAELEGKFLNRIHEDMIGDRDLRKLNGAKRLQNSGREDLI